MPDWDEDSPRLRLNLAEILSEIVRDSGDRVLPSRELSRGWQQSFLEGLHLPDPRYKGAYRGEEGLELIGVRIERFAGVAPSDISEALTRFEVELRTAIVFLDMLVPVGEEPNADQLGGILDVCAWAHAEWVRIHPFANGNGRTARLWANWIAVRYGLPPFVRLRPRPSDGYGDAGVEAMKGNWRATVEVFQQLLNDALLDPN